MPNASRCSTSAHAWVPPQPTPPPPPVPHHQRWPRRPQQDHAHTDDAASPPTRCPPHRGTPDGVLGCRSADRCRGAARRAPQPGGSSRRPPHWYQQQRRPHSTSKARKRKRMWWRCVRACVHACPRACGSAPALLRVQAHTLSRAHTHSRMRTTPQGFEGLDPEDDQQVRGRGRGGWRCCCCSMQPPLSTRMRVRSTLNTATPTHHPMRTGARKL